MLRACVIDFKSSWDGHLRLIELSYNNSYQSNIRMTPFEERYGRMRRSTVKLLEVREASILGREIIHEDLEKFIVIRDWLATAYSRQKSNGDKRK